MMVKSFGKWHFILIFYSSRFFPTYHFSLFYYYFSFYKRNFSIFFLFFALLFFIFFRNLYQKPPDCIHSIKPHILLAFEYNILRWGNSQKGWSDSVAMEIRIWNRCVYICFAIFFSLIFYSFLWMQICLFLCEKLFF